MAIDAQAILAGGNGGGGALAFFAPLGTAAPTDATTALAAAYLDAGLCTTDGLQIAVDESSTDINAYGLFSPARTLVTSSKQTFQVAFEESNPVSLAVYNRKSLTAIAPDATGAFDFATGAAAVESYAAVFEVTDGANHLRVVAENVQVTDRDGIQVQAGAAVQYGVTLTAYPGADGNSLHWYYLVPSQKSGV